MISLILGYIFLGAVFYVEHRYESSKSTTTIQTSGDDGGSTRLLVIVFAVCLMVNPVFWLLLGVGSGPAWLGWIGLGWIIGGLVLLRWTLFVNPFYLRSMATTDDQYICTEGPYKVVRHPGYTAFVVAWLGFGLTTANWFALLTTAVLVLYAYVKHIQSEEQMMLDRFGVDYQQYIDESFR